MKWLRHWWPALVWMVLIWGFSGASFSVPRTSRFIGPFLRWLLPNASRAAIDLLHTGIRKGGHVLGYFALGLLLLYAVRGGRAGWRTSWAWTAIALAGAYAAVDEIHQAFEPGRGASILDVLIDCGGAASAQWCAWLWMRRCEAKKKLARSGGTG